jgi:sugar/nucleoside kinase (ribokinase family)
MLKHEVVSITPAIIDIACDLTNREQVYLKLCALLESGPGQWKSVDDKKVIEELLGVVAGIVTFNLNDDFDSLGLTPGVRIEAGSTGLNLLSALSKPQRENSAMVSAVGSDSSGNPDSLANYFAKDAAKVGIYQYSIPHEGCTPLVLVFSHKDEPDKVTAMHPGVAAQVESVPRSVEKSKIVHIDAYDLTREPAFTTLDRLIGSGRVPIALGLGNSSILQGKLREIILRYIATKKITYLMGNSEEFGLLLNSNPIRTLEQATSLNAGQLAPYVLVTLGKDGLIGFEKNKPVFQRPFLQKNPVNTSGAGDTAAGIFLSGILSGQEFPLTLKESAYYSSQIVGSLSSRFTSDREKLYKDEHADAGDQLDNE